MKIINIDIIDCHTGEVWSKSRDNVHDLNKYYEDKILKKIRLALRASSSSDVCFQITVKNVKEELEIF